MPFRPYASLRKFRVLTLIIIIIIEESQCLSRFLGVLSNNYRTHFWRIIADYFMKFHTFAELFVRYWRFYTFTRFSIYGITNYTHLTVITQNSACRIATFSKVFHITRDIRSIQKQNEKFKDRQTERRIKIYTINRKK